MSNYVLVDTSGNIVNRIVLNNPAAWTVPTGFTLVADNGYDIGGTYINSVYTPPASTPTPAQPQLLMSQDLMAQFTATDIGTITTAVAGNTSFAMLWYSLLAQKDPMLVSNARFKTGWSALVTVLGQPRMTAIATALNITP